MKAAGFVNYAEEWWHYDLGDCIWSELKSAIGFTLSLEDELSLSK